MPMCYDVRMQDGNTNSHADQHVTARPIDALRDKVAFVTGSAGGIGLGIARACIDAGMKVALSDIDGATLEEAAAELRGGDADVVACILDVADRESWTQCAREVERALGPVHLLVNNAGVSTLGLRFDDITPAMWDRVISINLTGAFNGVRCFLGGMRAAGGGHIVNISSMGGLAGAPSLAPYVASKFGLVGLSEALQYELADSGIGVSVVCPGQVRSRLWRTSRAVKGLPDIETPPEDFTGGSARATMTSDEVGKRVLDAVVAGEFYVMTHPEFRGVVSDRHERLLRGFDVAEAFSGSL
jgi:NAD(P)-dependent dehydrogenase (short-subunit alcohol dehydrogenase family)